MDAIGLSLPPAARWIIAAVWTWRKLPRERQPRYYWISEGFAEPGAFSFTFPTSRSAVGGETPRGLRPTDDPDSSHEAVSLLQSGGFDWRRSAAYRRE
jgi:hypothetical protein